MPDVYGLNDAVDEGEMIGHSLADRLDMAFSGQKWGCDIPTKVIEVYLESCQIANFSYTRDLGVIFMSVHQNVPAINWEYSEAYLKQVIIVGSMVAS